MLAGLSNCITQKIYPSTITMLSIANPTNQIPKLVHVSCDPTSEAVTVNGYVCEAWYIPEFGIIQTRNGSNGENFANWLTPVNVTPTAQNTYHLSNSVIELYKASGSITGRWNTNTEYTIEIYT